MRSDAQSETALAKTYSQLRVDFHHFNFPLVANTTEAMIDGCFSAAITVNSSLTSGEEPANDLAGRPLVPAIGWHPVPAR
jgi:hypothetical protein